MRKLDWDYTNLAKAYTNRPDYAAAAIDAVLAVVKPDPDREVLDLGAGAGHLTAELAARGLPVLALEPNADMRAQGMERTRRFGRVRWMDGIMEETGLEEAGYSLATYGSSFGVVDRAVTLREAGRLLTDGGWFVCMFNHRDLDEPLQRRIEELIVERVPTYSYGTRREDQTPVIVASGLFGPVHRFECPIVQRVPAADWVTAWRSHATLKRQAGERFDEIVEGIGELVAATGLEVLPIPYVTRVWLAQRRSRAA